MTHPRTVPSPDTVLPAGSVVSSGADSRGDAAHRGGAGACSDVARLGDAAVRHDVARSSGPVAGGGGVTSSGAALQEGAGPRGGSGASSGAVGHGGSVAPDDVVSSGEGPQGGASPRGGAAPCSHEVTRAGAHPESAPRPDGVPRPRTSLDAVTFGEVMAMFVAEESGPLSEVRRFTRSLAGAEVNVATGLARLGHASGWVGRVGDDPFGAHAVAALTAEGVDTRRVAVDPEAPTAFQLKSRADTGDPEVVYFRRHSAGSRLVGCADTDAYLRGARHLHLTGIPPALSPQARDFTERALRVARRAGLTVSFDPNLRPVLWPDREEMISVLNELAVRADWVLPGIAEGRLLTGADDPAGIARHYLDLGVSRVVVKDGVRGAHLFDADGTALVREAFPVRAVDSVGAGDGFAAGLISGHLDGLGTADALRRAAAVGALATTSRGDRDGLPDRERLTAFLDHRTTA